MTTQPLTLAYIGNGKSTNRYHLPFVDQLPHLFRVKSVYVRHFNFAWPKRPDIHYSQDLAAILDDPEVDLVVITTPLDSHYDYIKQALLAGKHVLCEKPFLATAQEARELFGLAEALGLHLECYQNRRYDSDYLTSLEVIESGKLGDLLEVEMHFDYYRPEVPQGQDTFTLSSSFLYSHACHTLDQVIAYFGRPDRVVYDVRSLLGPNRMNDYFDLDLYYGPLKVSVKSSYFRLEERPSFQLYGSKGSFIKASKDRQEEDLKAFYMPDQPDFGLDRPEHYGILSSLNQEGHLVRQAIQSQRGDYGRVYQALYATLREGAPRRVQPQETLLQLEILEAGIASLKASWQVAP
ncbi:Gfo/Idh/MocA family oxidoreductase [uncultured Abiotrophia sp.]|uniref:Gfo/Idh/MocA family oxidoreductase n=1 Tax=uncultured Abiotrophia sp. TaxID=316094 RepID=UPI0028E91731|nr:Gfo/Idh/MocA family oxidoreductase [uncultured Abiotrophia sp.]